MTAPWTHAEPAPARVSAASPRRALGLPRPCGSSGTTVPVIAALLADPTTAVAATSRRRELAGLRQAQITALQRLAGNAAVGGLLRPTRTAAGPPVSVPRRSPDDVIAQP